MISKRDCSPIVLTTNQKTKIYISCWPVHLINFPSYITSFNLSHVPHGFITWNHPFFKHTKCKSPCAFIFMLFPQSRKFSPLFLPIKHLTLFHYCLKSLLPWTLTGLPLRINLWLLNSYRNKVARSILLLSIIIYFDILFYFRYFWRWCLDLIQHNFTVETLASLSLWKFSNIKITTQWRISWF